LPAFLIPAPFSDRAIILWNLQASMPAIPFHFLKERKSTKPAEIPTFAAILNG
jgi:hypothetical protein